MFVVFSIDGPRFAAVAALILALTASLWLFWPRYLHWCARIPSSKTKETLRRQDLFVSQSDISVISPDYAYVGMMQASFLCDRCNSPENIVLRLYHHLPSHQMIILSKHGCKRLVPSSDETVEVPAVPAWKRSA